MAGNGANGRIVSEVSTSSDDSDQDKVPALLSTGLSSFPEHCRRFKYRELEEATSGFSDALAIGEGGLWAIWMSMPWQRLSHLVIAPLDFNDS